MEVQLRRLAIAFLSALIFEVSSRTFVSKAVTNDLYARWALEGWTNGFPCTKGIIDLIHPSKSSFGIPYISQKNTSSDGLDQNSWGAI